MPKAKTPDRTDAACLLCGQPDLHTVEELTGKQIRSLWKALDCEFSPEAWSRIDEGCRVVLHRCDGCGFSFFDPTLAGNEAFYRQLERPEYYSPARPEFARTLQFVCQHRLRRVLDVGCGSGNFLDQAKRSGCETYGMELNTVAAEKVRAKGHGVFSRLLGALDVEQTRGGFDLITFFQVVEHLPDPITAMKQAAVLLNPGGYISIAVPSADGVYRLVPWDPHQWPPHHISRWHLKDFERLARAVPLRLAESGGDVLVGAQVEYFWNLQNRLAPVLGKPPRWGRETLPAVISFLYRKAGMKFVFPKWGCSIYAYFQKI